MKLVAKSARETTIWLPFLFLSATVHDIREKLFPRVKSETQIQIFSRESDLKNPKTAKLNSHENCPATRWNVNEFVFREIRVRLYPVFNYYAFRNCATFPGKSLPPKSESARTPMSIVIGLKKLNFFSLIHLPSCNRKVSYLTVCYGTVCYRTVQSANHIQSCSL